MTRPSAPGGIWRALPEGIADGREPGGSDGIGDNPNGRGNDDHGGDGAGDDSGWGYRLLAALSALVTLGALLESCGGEQVVPVVLVNDDRDATDANVASDTTTGDAGAGTDALPEDDASESADGVVGDTASPPADTNSGEDAAAGDVTASDTSLDATSPPLDADVAVDGTAPDVGTDTEDTAVDPADTVTPDPTVTLCTQLGGNSCLTDDPTILPAEIHDQTATLVDINAIIILKAGSAAAQNAAFDPAHFLNLDNDPILLTIATGNGLYPDALLNTVGTPLSFSLPAHVCILDENDAQYYDDNNFCFYPPQWIVAGMPEVSLTVESVSDPFAPDAQAVTVAWLHGLQSFIAPGSELPSQCTGLYFYPCLPMLSPVVTP